MLTGGSPGRLDLSLSVLEQGASVFAGAVTERFPRLSELRLCCGQE
jgi:hypothetical protein